MDDATGNYVTVTAALVLYAAFAVVFYRSVSERDLLLARTQRWLDRMPFGRSIAVVAYPVLTLVGVPLLLMVFAAVFAVLLAVLAVRDPADIAAISAALVTASRILAYLWPRASEELSKLVPFAILGVALSTGVSVDMVSERVELLAESDPGPYALAVIAVEWVLRLSLITIVAFKRLWSSSAPEGDQAGEEHSTQSEGEGRNSSRPGTAS